MDENDYTLPPTLLVSFFPHMIALILLSHTSSSSCASASSIVSGNFLPTVSGKNNPAKPATVDEMANNNQGTYLRNT